MIYLLLIPEKPPTPPINPDTFIPSTAASTPFGSDSQAPYAKSFVDANLAGGIFEKTPYLGFSVCMSGHLHLSLLLQI
jgi:hypothetical protein